MPYNSQQLEIFINKVNAEAEKAAQAVYDKYEPELILRIKKQMIKGDKLYIGMGTCDVKDKEVNNGFIKVITRTCYPTLSAGFNLGDIVND